MGRIAELGKLTPREAMFLRAYIKGETLGAAYLSVLPPDHPPLADGSDRNLGWRMLKRIRAKIDWPRLLESAGLGEIRLLREIEKRLGAMETHFYQDQVVSDCEDNCTRMRATDLLADLLGKRKSNVEVSGKLSTSEVHVYLPDNGRGDGPAPEVKHD